MQKERSRASGPERGKRQPWMVTPFCFVDIQINAHQQEALRPHSLRMRTYSAIRAPAARIVPYYTRSRYTVYVHVYVLHCIRIYNIYRARARGRARERAREHFHACAFGTVPLISCWKLKFVFINIP